MKRRTNGELIFWGAVVFASLFYFLTMPSGLAWNPAMVENRYWRYLVRMVGGSAMLLTSISAVGAAGLIGAIVNRYFGWRIAIASVIVWTFMPCIWNSVVTNDYFVVVAAILVGMAWVMNVVILWLTRKARAARTESAKRVTENLPGAHDVQKRRELINRLASWAALFVSVVFAVASLLSHDFRLGEVASEYARLVVDEADERVILMNGICDEQIVRDLEIRNAKLSKKDDTSLRHSSFIVHRRLTALSLHDNEENRAEIIAFAKGMFPNATNLWLEAEISPKAFGEAAAKEYPDRFYTMLGQSATLEKWTARWEAMKPYVGSADPFVPAMRRMMAYEGNAIGNKLQQDGELKAAWKIYYLIFTEIDKNNPAACVNMSEMLWRGYKVDSLVRKRIERVQEEYAKLMQDEDKAIRLARYISNFGPVMRDQKMYEELCERMRQRMEEIKARGETPVVPLPDLKTLEEWHLEMITSFQEGDFDRAANIARAILDRRDWRAFVPANMILGEKMSMEGKWVEAEVFLRKAIMGTDASELTAFVFNDYAEVLRQLQRYDEAEKYARIAIESSAEAYWMARLTLAQILRDAKAAGKMNISDDEIKALVDIALKHVPEEERELIVKDFPQ